MAMQIETHGREMQELIDFTGDNTEEMHPEVFMKFVEFFSKLHGGDGNVAKMLEGAPENLKYVILQARDGVGFLVYVKIEDGNNSRKFVLEPFELESLFKEFSDDELKKFFIIGLNGGRKEVTAMAEQCLERGIDWMPEVTEIVRACRDAIHLIAKNFVSMDEVKQRFMYSAY